MKQIDRIRNMNAEELAEAMIAEFTRPDRKCRYCIHNDICHFYMQHKNQTGYYSCKKGVAAWLESEVENNES